MQGATVCNLLCMWYITKFQSTPPMQGATKSVHVFNDQVRVSIHAPYAGSDGLEAAEMAITVGFNPRPLCRERR